MRRYITAPNTSGFIQDRIPFIQELCRGKDVLDVGCIDHEADHENGTGWLHKAIRSVAQTVTGVDSEAAEAEKLRQKGYSIIVGNAETIRLGNEYDVIVAGELIEHLSNPGLFLENMRAHLRDDGRMVITTPNAFALRYVIRHLRKGYGSDNAEHTFYYDYYTLSELCARAGLAVEQSYYFIDTQPHGLKRFFLNCMLAIRKSYAPRMLFVLKKATI